MSMKLSGFLILSYVTLASAASAIITPALPHLGKLYTIQKAELDWIMTIFLIGFALGQLVYGPLANKIGRVWSLRVGIFIHLIGLAFCIVSVGIESYVLLLISRFLTAFGGASGVVCVFILINETFTENEAKTLIPYIGLFFSVSVVLSIFIGGILTLYLGFVYCFYFNLLHALVLLFFTRKVKETLQPSLQGTSHSALPNLKTLRKTLFLSVGASLLPTFTYAYSTAIPLYAQSQLNLNEATYGLWNLLNLIGMFLCAFVTGKSCIKYGTAKTGKLGYFGFFFGLVALFLYFLFSLKSRLALFIMTSYLYFMAGVAASCAAYFASNALKDKALASSLLNFTTLLLGGLSLLLLSYLPLKSLPAFLITLSLFYFLAHLFFSVTKKEALAEP